jgi:hypothetical protein
MPDSDFIRNAITVGQFIVSGFCFFIWRMHTSVDTKSKENEVLILRQITDLAAYKLHVAETYMTNRAMEVVMAKLDRIEDKLDKKQDKV